MERLPATLERLQDSGYALKDIAILVRTNQEGALVLIRCLPIRKSIRPTDTITISSPMMPCSWVVLRRSVS